MTVAVYLGAIDMVCETEICGEMSSIYLTVVNFQYPPLDTMVPAVFVARTCQ